MLIGVREKMNTQCLPLFIVAAENMNKEAIYMLESEAFMSNAAQFLSDIGSESVMDAERTSYQEHYQDVSQENIELLREIYKNDIYIFDYPDTPFVDFLRSWRICDTVMWHVQCWTSNVRKLLKLFIKFYCWFKLHFHLLWVTNHRRA